MLVTSLPSFPLFSRVARTWVLLALAAILPLASAGCADIMASSADDRNKGIQLYNDGSYADAAGAFHNAIKVTPGDYRSHYYLGRSYDSMKAHQQAISSYRTALGLSKRAYETPEQREFQWKIYDGLAAALASSPAGDSDIAALQQKQPSTAEDQLILAKIHRLRGDVDSALDAYKQSVMLDPSSLGVAKEYGLYLLQLNQADQARAQLKRAYVLNRRASRAEDREVVAALRSVGVIPGPSLGEERDLVQPPLPQGPLPEVDVSKINPFGGEASTSAER